MNFEDILWLALVFYLGWRVYEMIRVRQKKSPKLRLISQKTGQVIEVNLLDDKGESVLRPIAPEEAFILLAKDMFTRIVHAFTTGEEGQLKALVSPKVLDAFRQAIETRRQNNQHKDFTLVDFKEVKVLEPNSDKVRQVAFTTEQINLLKDAQGNIVSGDPMYVTTVNEIWTFERQADDVWRLVATKQGDKNVA